MLKETLEKASKINEDIQRLEHIKKIIDNNNIGIKFTLRVDNYQLLFIDSGEIEPCGHPDSKVEFQDNEKLIEILGNFKNELRCFIQKEQNKLKEQFKEL